MAEEIEAVTSPQGKIMELNRNDEGEKIEMEFDGSAVFKELNRSEDMAQEIEVVTSPQSETMERIGKRRVRRAAPIYIDQLSSEEYDTYDNSDDENEENSQKLPSEAEEQLINKKERNQGEGTRIKDSKASVIPKLYKAPTNGDIKENCERSPREAEEQLINKNKRNPGEGTWIKDSEAIVIPKLYEAATNGDIKAFENLDDEENILIRDALSPQKNTILHVAASFGHEEIVRWICERYPRLSYGENSNGDTPAHLAAQYGHLSVIRVLIKVAQNLGDTVLTTPNYEGNTALHVATMNGHEMIFQEICWYQNWAFLRNKEKENPCYFAAEAGLVDAFKDMFPLPEISPQIKHPLHAAIVGRHTALVEMITKKQPTIVGIKDKDGRTALHYAAFLGFLEAVTCLLQNDTSSAYKMDKKGFFPIHWAASKGHANVIQCLIERCPDSRELLNRKGQNALHVAAKNGKEKVVTYVLKTRNLEKLINERDHNGNTPLHLATRHFHPKIVSILTRDERVKKNLLNNKGMTPLDVAENTETKAWFQKELTKTALKVVNAPRARNKNIFHEGFGKRNIKGKSNGSNLESFKDRVNTLLLVATLVATMAFTAGFTIPGGNTSDEPNPGKAILLSKIWFQTFVICNTIAMYSAIIVVVALIWAQLGEINLIKLILKWVTPLLVLSLTTISIAFTTGVSLVVRELHWLAIVVYILSFIFLLGALFLFVPLCLPYDSKRPIMRSISYCVFRLLIFITKRDHEDKDENMEM